jgi:hypothetical protein
LDILSEGRVELGLGAELVAMIEDDERLEGARAAVDHLGDSSWPTSRRRKTGSWSRSAASPSASDQKNVPSPRLGRVREGVLLRPAAAEPLRRLNSSRFGSRGTRWY